MLLDSFIFLQAPGGGAGSYANLIFLGMLLAVFYFFLIRPQAKRQKDQKKFAEALEKGDDVVTAGGIYGKINKIEDDIITLEVGSKTYIRVARSVISKDMTEASNAPEKESK